MNIVDLIMPMVAMLLVAALVAVAAISMRLHRDRRIQAWRYRKGCCPHCGYDVRATRSLCPECGKTVYGFAPNDETPVTGLARRLKVAVFWSLVALLCLLIAVMT